MEILLVLGLIVIGVFVVGNVLREDPGIKRLRKEIAEEKFLARVVYSYQLVKVEGVNGLAVIAVNPNNPVWNDKVEYVIHKLEQLLARTNHCCFYCGKKFGTVRISVLPMKRIAAVTLGDNHFRPAIIFSDLLFSERSDQLDDTITHEAAHLATCLSFGEHPKEWSNSYSFLLKN